VVRTRLKTSRMCQNEPGSCSTVTRIIELRLSGRRGVDEALEISLDHGSVILTRVSTWSSVELAGLEFS
jgi:hypothetical protein